MTDVELARYRIAIKKSKLHYLCDDWNNHKRGKAHNEIKPYLTEKMDLLYGAVRIWKWLWKRL